MKYFYLTLLLFSQLWSVQGICHDQVPFNVCQPLIDHLSTVNQYWQYHESELKDPQQLISYKSDIDRIAHHLDLVCSLLKSNTPNEVEHNAIQVRRAMIDTLALYQSRKQYPINNHHAARTPYFIDDFGTACAVGYLMQASGERDLAQKIHDTHNYELIKDIPLGEVETWAATHGFSVDELKLIQPTYAAYVNARPVGAGTDSTVRCLVPTRNGAFAGGYFSMIGQDSCSGVVELVDSSLNCYISASGWKVSDMSIESHVTFAAGRFEHNGNTYGLLRDEFTPELVFLQNGYEYVGGAVEYSNVDGLLFECNFYDSSDCHLRKYNSGGWSTVASIHGRVNDIVRYADGRTIAGSFDSITAHYSWGDSTFAANNIAQFNSDSDTWSLYPDEIDNEVFALEAVGDELYVGGRCKDPISGEFTFCGVRYTNGAFQPIVHEFQLSGVNSETAIYDFAVIGSDSNERIAVAGNIEFFGMFDPQFRGLAVYDPQFATFDGYGLFDGPVYALAASDVGLYVGGDFDSASNVSGLNNICLIPQETDPTSVGHINPPSELRIYPNPSENTHTLLMPHKLGENVTLKLYDVLGNKLATEQISNGRSNHVERDISMLSQGTYFYVIQTESNSAFVSFVKR